MRFTAENNILGNNILALRKAKKLSARKISLDLGQNQGYINNIETGKAFPSLSNLLAICDYLGCQAEDLFYDKNIVKTTKSKELLERIEKLSDDKREALETVLRVLENN